jgi:hypothetical protein
MPLVRNPQDIRLAMLGSTVGNGHPYSWSALFNGYDRELMTKECPFPGIPAYLNKEPAATVAIPGARVTHIHCAGSGGFTASGRDRPFTFRRMVTGEHVPETGRPAARSTASAVSLVKVARPHASGG